MTQRTPEERPAESSEEKPQPRTEPPDNPEPDREAIEKGKEQLEKVLGG
jgi:hypothetical protein